MARVPAADWRSIATGYEPIAATAATSGVQSTTVPDVFLSYSRANEGVMRRVRDGLVAAGFSVWVDETLEPGTPTWEAAIASAIESAKCCVVILSPSAKQSLWVGREVGYAESHGVTVIPVLAEGNEQVAVPLRLSSTQRIDARSDLDRALTDLIAAVRRRAGDAPGTAKPGAAPAGEKGWSGEALPAGVRRGHEAPVLLWEPRPGVVVELVHVPGGEFPMGSEEKIADEIERPRHLHPVAPFFIGRRPVTASQYHAFCDATDRERPAPPSWPSSPRHPIVNVDWEDAASFCTWLGGRLPGEAEWEKAARGSDERRFPWGDEPPSPDRCVWDGSPMAGSRSAWQPSRGRFVKESVNERHSAARGPESDRERPAGQSPYGALDMAGTVWEWCAVWFEREAYTRYAAGDLHAPRTGKARVTRGGSWDSPPHKCRATTRGAVKPDARNEALGFRVVLPMPGTAPGPRGPAAPSSGTVAKSRLVLLVPDGARTRRLQLEPGPESVWTIGRAETNAIHLATAHAEPEHCVIELDAKGWWVRPLRGDTYHDGVPLTERTSLAGGSVLAIGDVEIEIVEAATGPSR